ncbi:MAG: hypothetical protein M1831_004084 [Alyxoria varia]|nr:MAG: hypothetical protein M1831_004084 [Alyxoria varia]
MHCEVVLSVLYLATGVLGAGIGVEDFISHDPTEPNSLKDSILFNTPQLSPNTPVVTIPADATEFTLYGFEWDLIRPNCSHVPCVGQEYHSDGRTLMEALETSPRDWQSGTSLVRRASESPSLRNLPSADFQEAESPPTPHPEKQSGHFEDAILPWDHLEVPEQVRLRIWTEANFPTEAGAVLWRAQRNARTTTTITISVVRERTENVVLSSVVLPAGYNVSPFLVWNLYRDLETHEGVTENWVDFLERTKLILKQTLNDAQNIVLGDKRLTSLSNYFTIHAMRYAIYGHQDLPPETRVQRFSQQFNWGQMTRDELFGVQRAMLLREASFYRTLRDLPSVFARRFNAYRTAYRFALEVLDWAKFEEAIPFRYEDPADTSLLRLGVTERTLERPAIPAHIETRPVPEQVERLPVRPSSTSLVPSSTQNPAPESTRSESNKPPPDESLPQKRRGRPPKSSRRRKPRTRLIEETE